MSAAGVSIATSDDWRRKELLHEPHAPHSRGRDGRGVDKETNSMSLTGAWLQHLDITWKEAAIATKLSATAIKELKYVQYRPMPNSRFRRFLVSQSGKDCAECADFIEVTKS